MRRLIFSPTSTKDLSSIYKHIRKDSPGKSLKLYTKRQHYKYIVMTATLQNVDVKSVLMSSQQLAGL